MFLSTCAMAHQTSSRASTVGGIATAGAEIPVDEGRTTVQRAGTVVDYLFTAPADGIYVIELTQSGLDFSITVTSPEAGSRKFNSPLRRDERELVLVETTVGDVHRITVSSDEPTNAAGEHTLLISPATTHSPHQQQYIEAMRLMSRGAELYDTGNPEASLEAVETYRRSAVLWQELGSARGQAQALYSVAMLEYWVNYDWKRSARLAGEAAALYADLGLESLHANTTALRAATSSSSLG
jgi:hypothetical protein